MIKRVELKNEYNYKFLYLGKEYDVIYTNSECIEFGETKVFVGKNIDLNKMLKNFEVDAIINHQNMNLL